jgi:hypothetical protein
MAELTKTFVTYAAQSKLLELTNDIVDARLLIKKPSVWKDYAEAAKIEMWITALQYSEYLDKDTIDKLVYCLAELSDANAIPYAPTAISAEPPSIIVGGSTIINNYYYQTGTNFINSDIDIGTEAADSFTVSSAYGAVWHYTLRSGVNQRSGTMVASWLSSGSSVVYDESSTDDIGSTSDVELSVDYSGGNIRLLATTISNNWVLEGTRFLING